MSAISLSEETPGTGHAHAGHDHGDAESDQFAAPAFPDAGPARTVTIQKSYASKLRGRLGAINAEARRGIIDRDVFGLKASGGERPEQLASSDFDPGDLTPADFPARGDQARTDAFMDWLRRQHRRGVLTVISTDRNTYIRRAYDEGTNYARRTLQDAGLSPEEMPDESALPDEATARAWFNAPVRAEVLDTLYSRNYDQLEGITSDHATRINRILTDAFLQGLNPREIGPQITDATAVAQRRATALARYETMYAHNLSAVNSYEQAGVEKVGVVTTSPCPSCAAIAAGAPYTLAEARGLLPDHPNCQCCYSPRLGT